MINPGAALRFVDALDPGRVLWVFGAAIRGAWTVATFTGPRRVDAASQWIGERYRAGGEAWLALGDIARPVSGAGSWLRKSRDIGS